MKGILVILCLLLCFQLAWGQSVPEVEKGVVSYVSSQHIYVKFASTEHIELHDTLYRKKGDRLVPALLVENKSSISCVCSLWGLEKLKVSDEIYCRIKPEEKVEEAMPPDTLKVEVDTVATVLKDKRWRMPQDETNKQKIRGRISVGSYSTMSDRSTSHRMRYTFSYQGDHLKDSRFSVDSYITFRHTINEWEEVRKNFSNALKVYSLGVKYDLDRRSSLHLGRSINPSISSMGAIDGVQYQRGLGNFILGVIAGSRPDMLDYGLNLHMLEAGAYLTHISNRNNNYQQSTFAVVEQTNHGHIDRRFVYFQHSSNPIKDLNVFGSMELDLYRNFNNTPSSALSLTNLFVSMRYRVSKTISTTLSYDNRKNIIYYESYKNYIDSLIENETRQGLRLNGTIRPFKYVSFGASLSWRFQKGDKNVSKNLNAYLNWSKLPFWDVSASLTANFLQTSFLKSKVFGLRLTKDLISGKLNTDLYLRMVDYQYTTYEFNTQQYLAGAGLNYRLTKKIALYLYYEGTFDKRKEMYNRFNTKIIKRF